MGVAQLEERFLCKEEDMGSSPITYTTSGAKLQSARVPNPAYLVVDAISEATKCPSLVLRVPSLFANFFGGVS